MPGQVCDRSRLIFVSMPKKQAKATSAVTNSVWTNGGRWKEGVILRRLY